MTQPRQPERPGLTAHIARVPQWVWMMALAGAIYAVIARATLGSLSVANLHFRIDLMPIFEAPAIIQMHVTGAVTAFTVGLVLLFAPKGFRLHKTLGWAWVAAMGTTAISSLFITGLNGASYSPIHALSAWTMIMLPFGIAAIRRRDVTKHRSHMTGMYLGGMGIAGLFSFLPGRLMFSLFFSV